MPRIAAVTVLALASLAPDVPATSVPQDAFGPLEPLVGSCWKGTFPDGKSNDEHCWEWVWKGKFLRDRHVVRGPQPDYAGETIYGWDPEKRQLRFWYFTNAGFFTTGVMQPREGSAVFPETVVGGGGRRELETVFTRPSPDSYQVASREKTAAGWKDLWTMELKRVPGTPPR
jgi:hypothetical protein